MGACFGNKRKNSEDESITNCFDYDQNYSNDELKFIIRRLQEENKYKSEKIDELVEEHNSNQERKEKEWSKRIDIFVEQWYEKNKEEIGIGVLDLHFTKIDLFPDYIEKYIYKKVLKLAYSFFFNNDQ